ncbi:VWA domain-containing protein [Actinomadura rudentiformis]|uniref:VWA domain-containing protein n=1 Tax=Actinomadura rudentiformis TaxID=359158 RepID=A0A6H9YYB7_9ACTN|nr:VWA domain-containing protein [Actinomadura rudentiformis]KAB2351523.1 VWA domain-containing protein [Actinomadura rudentiformis]
MDGSSPWSPPGGDPAPEARRNHDRLTVAAAIALAAGLLLGAGGWALTRGGPDCDGRTQWLAVTVDPAIAPAATIVAERYNAAQRAKARCALVRVTAGDSDRTSASFATGQTPPDAWIPDSSLWIDLARGKAKRTAGPSTDVASVASSPLVFALPAQGGGAEPELELEDLSWRGLTAGARSRKGGASHDGGAGPGGGAGAGRGAGPGGGTGGTLRLRMLDPDRTGAGIATLLALEESSGGLEGFARMLRTTKLLPAAGAGERMQAEKKNDGHVHVAVLPEQAVWSQNRGTGSRMRAIYPADRTPYLDFPFTVVTTNPDKKRIAQDFRTALRSARTAGDLQRTGLRGPVGTVPALRDGGGRSSLLLSGKELSAPASSGMAVAKKGAAARIQRVWQAFARVTNILVVVDPPKIARSGPAAGLADPAAQPLSKMMTALGAGFASMADSSAFGLWKVSTGRGRPYVPLAPVRELGDTDPDGVAHRLRLQEALRKLQPRQDGTARLYEAIRAAQREVTRTHVPDKLNVVLVLTSGADKGGGSAGPAALRKVRQSYDRKHPVNVIVLDFDGTIAPELRTAAQATGGCAFKIDNFRRIMGLFQRSDSMRIADGNAMCGS